MLPTIQGSEATSTAATADGEVSVTATGGDEWLPTGASDAEATTTSGGADGPSITFESAAGHQVVLTYHDLVMLALLATLAAAAWRGVQ